MISFQIPKDFFNTSRYAIQTEAEKRSLEDFIRAKKFTQAQYPEPFFVWLPECPIGDTEGYFSSVQDLYEQFARAIEVGEICISDLPDYCFGCRPVFVCPDDEEMSLQLSWRRDFDTVVLLEWSCVAIAPCKFH